MKQFHGLCFLAAALLLSACTSVPLPPHEGDAPPEASPGAASSSEGGAPAVGTPAADTFPLGSVGVAVPEPLPPPPALPPVSGNSAVVALLDRARVEAEGGRRESAGAALERALRIEPRNGWLWHELAQVRLGLGKYAQAISLAQKSNSFAGAERRLQAFNWRLIGDAHIALGNAQDAEQAFKRADELAQ